MHVREGYGTAGWLLKLARDGNGLKNIGTQLAHCCAEPLAHLGSKCAVVPFHCLLEVAEQHDTFMCVCVRLPPILCPFAVHGEVNTLSAAYTCFAA
eukprot:363418-Chlamydomonas_euryale.AAC.8